MEYTLVLEFVPNYSLTTEEFFEQKSRCRSELASLFGHKNFKAPNPDKAEEMADNYAKGMLEKHNEECNCRAWDYQLMVFEAELSPF
jgi:hypothetical protein